MKRQSGFVDFGDFARVLICAFGIAAALGICSLVLLFPVKSFLHGVVFGIVLVLTAVCTWVAAHLSYLELKQ